MHAEIMIGGNTIMFADSTNVYGVQNAGMFIYVDNADETFKKAINKGGTVVSELTDQSCGRNGGVQDSFENTWWVTLINKN